MPSKSPPVFPCAPRIVARMELFARLARSLGSTSRRRGEGEAALREGRRPRAVARVQEIPDLLPRDPLRLISTWSLAILATIAIGFVLYVGREVLLPVTAAFIVGVMLSPVARRLEALRVPPPLAALLLVAGVTLIVALVIALIVPRVSELTNGLPGIVASLREKLHVFDGVLALVASFRFHGIRAAGKQRRHNSVARYFLGSIDDIHSVAADYRISVLSRGAPSIHRKMA